MKTYYSFLLLSLTLILTGCSLSGRPYFSTGQSDINLPTLYNELDLMLPFESGINIEKENLGKIGSTEVFKIIGAYQEFKTDFRKDGDGESIFFCKTSPRSTTNEVEQKKNCIMQSISLPELGFKILTKGDKTKQQYTKISDGKISVNDGLFYVSHYKINTGESFVSQITKTVQQNKSGFKYCLLSGEITMLTENGNILQWGYERFNQTPDLLYEDPTFSMPYTGKVLKWAPNFGGNINKLIKNGKFQFVEGGSFVSTLEGNRYCSADSNNDGFRLFFWFKDIPDIYYKIEDKTGLGGLGERYFMKPYYVDIVDLNQ